MGYTSVNELVQQYRDCPPWLDVKQGTESDTTAEIKKEVKKAKQIGCYLWNLDRGNKKNWQQIRVYEDIRDWFFSKVLPSCIYQSRNQRIRKAVAAICFSEKTEQLNEFQEEKAANEAKARDDARGGYEMDFKVAILDKYQSSEKNPNDYERMVMSMDLSKVPLEALIKYYLYPTENLMAEILSGIGRDSEGNEIKH